MTPEERKLEADEVMSNAFEIYQQTSPILERHFANNDRNVSQPAPQDKRDEVIKKQAEALVLAESALRRYSPALREHFTLVRKAIDAIDAVMPKEVK